MSHRGIYGISTEIGQLHPIDDILIEGDSNELLEELKERGVNTFAKIDTNLSQLIINMIQKTLKNACLDPRDIDGIMIVTESYSGLVEREVERGGTPFRSGRNLLFELLAEIGLQKVSVFSSTYGGSGNFLQAMILADSIIQAGRIDNLLIVCFDRHPTDASRFMIDAIAATGDGIATFIYGKKTNDSIPYHEVQYIGITPYLNVSQCGSTSEKMLELYRCTKSAGAHCLEMTGMELDSYQWLILNNYNYVTSKLLSKLLGFSMDKTWMHNVARIGHIPACDSIINYHDLAQSGNIRNNSSTLIYVTGPISCGVIALKSFF